MSRREGQAWGSGKMTCDYDGEWTGENTKAKLVDTAIPRYALAIQGFSKAIVEYKGLIKDGLKAHAEDFEAVLTAYPTEA